MTRRDLRRHGAPPLVRVTDHGCHGWAALFASIGFLLGIVFQVLVLGVLMFGVPVLLWIAWGA